MLVDEKCLKALAKVGLDRAAKNLAKTCEESGAATAEITLSFLADEEEATGPYIANLKIQVKKL